MDLKDAYRNLVGYWNENLQGFLDNDQGFFESYIKLVNAARAKHRLAPKIQALIALSVNVATTGIYSDDVRGHIRAALHNGATEAEIREVLQLVSVLGIHACTEGMAIVLEAFGRSTREAPPDARRQDLKERFQRERGYWSDFWEGLLVADPDFFEAYLEFSSYPWKTGVLEPKVKELIYLAIDVATTHLYLPGLRAHLKNAIRYGASFEEIVEVIEIVSEIGIHSYLEGTARIREIKD